LAISENRHAVAEVTRGSLNLEALLSPIGVEQFFERYWERNYLHIQGRSAAYYQHLIGAGDLEQIISNPDARYPAIQMAKGGRYFPSEAYTRNVKFGSEIFIGVPDLRRISIEYRNGASVVLPALHRTWLPLKNLCATLETQLDHVPHANAYITPGNAAGFTPHYDVHEVFVLQLSGKKRWSIYPPTIHLPPRSQPFTPQGYEAPPPMAQTDLIPGDLLYLPRGYIHSAATSDSHSAHVTIGISVYTWSDLTQDLVENSADDERLRPALPAGFAKRADLKFILKQRLTELLGHRAGIDYDQLIEVFTRGVRSGQSAPSERFRIDVVAIDEQSPLQTAARSQYGIVQDAVSTVLEFKGKRHVFPAELAPILRAISERSIFRTAELPANLPAEARLGLSRYLLDIGFLTRVQCPA
jgi:ribosomal protein L16 Arg81 hydroxylase